MILPYFWSLFGHGCEAWALFESSALGKVEAVLLFLVGTLGLFAFTLSVVWLVMVWIPKWCDRCADNAEDDDIPGKGSDLMDHQVQGANSAKDFICVGFVVFFVFWAIWASRIIDGREVCQQRIAFRELQEMVSELKDKKLALQLTKLKNRFDASALASLSKKELNDLRTDFDTMRGSVLRLTLAVHNLQATSNNTQTVLFALGDRVMAMAATPPPNIKLSPDMREEIRRLTLAILSERPGGISANELTRVEAQVSRAVSECSEAKEAFRSVMEGKAPNADTIKALLPKAAKDNALRMGVATLALVATEYAGRVIADAIPPSKLLRQVLQI